LDLLAESIFLETYKELNNILEVPLDEVLVGVKNCNPASLFGKSNFTYIDIGAINNLSKAIVSPQVINGIDAPSRARQIILAGDVLVSTVRPNLNCVALVDEDYINPVASTGFCVLRCNHEKILPEFLFLLVRTQKFIQNLVNQATGASYPAVSDKIIKSSKVNLPSIQLQTEFVKKIKIISSKKIKLKNHNRKLISLLDSLQSQAFSGKL
jgi:type I restriction enzyme S subunit